MSLKLVEAELNSLKTEFKPMSDVLVTVAYNKSFQKGLT